MVRAYEKTISSFSATHTFVTREVMTEEKVSRPEADDSCNMFCSWATFLSSWRSNAADDGSAKIECQLALVLSLCRRERICRQTADMAGNVCMERSREASQALGWSNVYNSYHEAFEVLFHPTETLGCDHLLGTT